MATVPTISRPFLCEECGSRYTRQEHLDRHIAAKHRAHKAFICATCNKGFARRDILRRHEGNHNRVPVTTTTTTTTNDSTPNREGSVSSITNTNTNTNTPIIKVPKVKKETKKRQLELLNALASTSNSGNSTGINSIVGGSNSSTIAGGVSGNGTNNNNNLDETPAAKILRISRACDKCSRSKLRCDGEDPCSRCTKVNIICTFDRLPKQLNNHNNNNNTNNNSTAPSLANSTSPSLSDNSFTADSAEDGNYLSQDDSSRRFDRDNSLGGSGSNDYDRGIGSSGSNHQNHQHHNNHQHSQHQHHHHHHNNNSIPLNHLNIQYGTQNQNQQNQQQQQHHHPDIDQWNRPNLQLSPASAFALATRPSPYATAQLIQHSLPPASFLHPTSASPPSIYPYPSSLRPSEPFPHYQRFPNTTTTNSTYQSPLPTPHSHLSPLSNPANTVHFPSQAALAAANLASWDSMPFGRPSTDTNSNSINNNTEFLDLIASASSETDLDWALLESSYPNRSLSDHYGLMRGGTGFTPREGNSPGTQELIFEGVLNHDPTSSTTIIPSSSSQNHQLDQSTLQQQQQLQQHLSQQPSLQLDTTGMNLPNITTISSTTTSSSTPITNPKPEFSRLGIISSGQSPAELRIQDSAAESLLSLASHTPRDTPEPETRPPDRIRSPLSMIIDIKEEDFNNSNNHHNNRNNNNNSSHHNNHNNQSNQRSYTSQIQQQQHSQHQSQHSHQLSRTSHPSHIPSDPWPLSYRPNLGSEEIIPSLTPRNFRSRASSPQLELSHVPHLSPESRIRILEDVREISENYTPFNHSDRFVPKLIILDLFIQLFFDKADGNFLPLIHKASFDPNSCPTFLTIAIASIGARYAGDLVLGASVYAQALSETARRMIQIVQDSDNTAVRTVAWQQTLLFMLVAGLFSGNKKDLERTQANACVPITFCRRQGWLKEPVVDEEYEESLSVDARWMRWRDREEIKRLGFGAILIDGLGSATWNLETSSLFADAAKSFLPCSEELFEAPTALAWQSLFSGTLPPKGPDTLTAISQITDRSLHSSESLLSIPRGFALTSLLTILHSIGWTKMQENHITSMFLPQATQSERTFSPVQVSIEVGLEFFQDRILLPPEIQEWDSTLSTPIVTGSGPLLLHLTSMTQRLPLRILQALARTGDPKLTNEISLIVSNWNELEGGRIARDAAWHAGQILSMVNIGKYHEEGIVGGGKGKALNLPIEPMAIFYATLVLLAFVRGLNSKDGGVEGSTSSIDQSILKDVEMHSIGVEGVKMEEDSEGEVGVKLDQTLHRTDSNLMKWITSGEGKISLDLNLGGNLRSEGFSFKLLTTVSDWLKKELKVWKVGELLGISIDESILSGKSLFGKFEV